MKKLSKQLGRRVLATLNKDPNFKDVYQMVINRSKTKPYLVGGKLYRTLVEIIYDYPARSHSCDFDFAAEDIRKNKKRKKIRERGTIDANNDFFAPPVISAISAITARPSPYSGDSVKMRTESGCSIDLICIADLVTKNKIKYPATIEGYFSSVPLSIQAIAMDLDRCEIFGKVGIDSINEKFVWINNKDTLANYCNYKGYTIPSYIRDKTDSIRFACDASIQKIKKAKKIKGYTICDNFTAIANGGQLNWHTETINVTLPTFTH